MVSPELLPTVFTIFWPNLCGSRFLRYTVVGTPQTQLVWSRKTTSPSKYNNGEPKYQVSKRYANLTNIRPKLE